MASPAALSRLSTQRSPAASRRRSRSACIPLRSRASKFTTSRRANPPSSPQGGPRSTPSCSHRLPARALLTDSPSSHDAPQVFDLLQPAGAKALSVRNNPQAGFFVEKLSSFPCEGFSAAGRLLKDGLKRRAVGSHRLNAGSSRSHCIFTLSIVSEPAEARTGTPLAAGRALCSLQQPPISPLSFTCPFPLLDLSPHLSPPTALLRRRRRRNSSRRAPWRTPRPPSRTLQPSAASERSPSWTWPALRG